MIKFPQVLCTCCQVSIIVDASEAQEFSKLAIKPLRSLPYDSLAQTFVAFEKPEGVTAVGKFSNTLRFILKEVLLFLMCLRMPEILSFSVAMHVKLLKASIKLWYIYVEALFVLVTMLNWLSLSRLDVCKTCVDCPEI